MHGGSCCFWAAPSRTPLARFGGRSTGGAVGLKVVSAHVVDLVASALWRGLGPENPKFGLGGLRDVA